MIKKKTTHLKRHSILLHKPRKIFQSKKRIVWLCWGMCLIHQLVTFLILKNNRGLRTGDVKGWGSFTKDFRISLRMIMIVLILNTNSPFFYFWKISMIRDVLPINTENQFWGKEVCLKISIRAKSLIIVILLETSTWLSFERVDHKQLFSAIHFFKTQKSIIFC